MRRHDIMTRYASATRKMWETRINFSKRAASLRARCPPRCPSTRAADDEGRWRKVTCPGGAGCIIYYILSSKSLDEKTWHASAKTCEKQENFSDGAASLRARCPQMSVDEGRRWWKKMGEGELPRRRGCFSSKTRSAAILTIWSPLSGDVILWVKCKCRACRGRYAVDIYGWGHCFFFC